MKSVENKDAITEGLYKMSGLQSKVLKYLYVKMSEDPELNGLCNRALNNRFFNYNRGNLYIVPSDNAFIIKPPKGKPVSQVSVYELSF